MLANEAWEISFLLFKLLINFKISWSLNAEPWITTRSDPLYSIASNFTLLGTADAICAKTLKLIFLFDPIDLLSSIDFKIFPISFAYLFFSKVFNSCYWTTWSYPSTFLFSSDIFQKENPNNTI